MARLARRRGERVARGGGRESSPGRGVPPGWAWPPPRLGAGPSRRRRAKGADTSCHLAQRSWAASAAARATRLVWTFQVQSQQIHTQAHTRARARKEHLSAASGSAAASLSPPRSYWRGGYCFIYLFPPPRSGFLPRRPPSRPLRVLPHVCEVGPRRSDCNVLGLHRPAEAAAARWVRAGGGAGTAWEGDAGAAGPGPGERVSGGVAGTLPAPRSVQPRCSQGKWASPAPRPPARLLCARAHGLLRPAG